MSPKLSPSPRAACPDERLRAVEKLFPFLARGRVPKASVEAADLVCVSGSVAEDPWAEPLIFADTVRRGGFR